MDYEVGCGGIVEILNVQAVALLDRIHVISTEGNQLWANQSCWSCENLNSCSAWWSFLPAFIQTQFGDEAIVITCVTRVSSNDE